MATTFIRRRVLHDLIRDEVCAPYNMEAMPIRNTTGTDIPKIIDPVGYPLKAVSSGGYVLALAGDEASVVALLCEELPIIIDLPTGTNSAKKYPILARGPMVCVIDGIPPLDIAGGTFDRNAIAAALLTQNIVVRLSPPTVSTQST